MQKSRTESNDEILPVCEEDGEWRREKKERREKKMVFVFQ